MQDDVYIKLNDELYFFVGRYELELDGGVEFHPASPKKISPLRFGIRRKGNGTFERREEWDGFEFELPDQYKHSVIKRTFDPNV